MTSKEKDAEKMNVPSTNIFRASFSEALTNLQKSFSSEVKRIRRKLIKYPWQKTEREEEEERRKRREKREKEGFRKEQKQLRVKFPERHKPITVGPGYPPLGLVYANMPIARNEQQRNLLYKSSSGTKIVYEPLETELPGPLPDKAFEEYCHKIGIDHYEVGDSKGKSKEAQDGLNLKSFDLYYDDIQVERSIILKEVKHIPLYTRVDVVFLEFVEKAIYNISRSCYYSSQSTHTKCEDVVHILIWFLNRRNLPVAFHLKIIQALSLILHSSRVFKNELVYCGGIRVLYRTIQIGMLSFSLQASWACYALTVAAIGSPLIIKQLQSMSDFDETIGELTFSLYWYYWPTNFANILQGLVYGPGGVANVSDTFEFL